MFFKEEDSENFEVDKCSRGSPFEIFCGIFYLIEVIKRPSTGLRKPRIYNQLRRQGREESIWD